jgi:hypothetical protein
MNMKTCSKCNEAKPLSEYYTKKNGKPIAMCKACKREALNAWRRRQPSRSVISLYTPNYTQMRHPDAMVMEGNVQKMMKKYAENEAKIDKAHLGFIPEAGLCDIIIEDSF